MTDQEMADKTQAAIAEAIKLAQMGVRRACAASVKDQMAQPVVAPISRALGHLWAAHAETTEAALTMPQITPRFGDK